MAPMQTKRLLLPAVVVAAVAFVRSKVFVPVPSTVRAKDLSISSTAACAAALFAAENAHADAIGDAAVKLSKAAYPFMKDVPWNSNLYNLNPGTSNPILWTKAIAKLIDMGASMDANLLKAGVNAHHAAIAGLGKDGVCTEPQLIGINAAIGRLIASVPESKTMDVYNEVAALVDPSVPPYLMSTVNDVHAKAAYAALIDFTKVVKENPITPFTPMSTVNGYYLDEAAQKLSEKSYPLIKEIDWTSNIFQKPVPGATPQDALKAIDKMLVMGSAMDGGALKEAARAHVKAIEGIDAKGVPSLKDYTAINVGLGKAIASVPTSKVMDVYNAMAKFLGSSPIPNKMFSMVNPNDAQAAYNALLEFKDVVKAAQK